MLNPLNLFRWKKPVHVEMAKCERCDELVSARAGLSLISHLIDFHRLPELQAIEVTEEKYKQIIHRIRRKGEQNVS